MKNLLVKNSILLLLLVLSLILWVYQKNSLSNEWLRMTFDSLSTLLATLIGVMFSFQIGISQQKKYEKDKSLDKYKHTLPVIWAELDTNLTILKNLYEGINGMPKNIRTYYDQYQFLSEAASGIRMKAFDGLLSSGEILDIAQINKDLFNMLQIANYNTLGVIDGLKLSIENFKSYVNLTTIDQDLVDMSDKIVNGETNKIKRTIEYTEEVLRYIDEELLRYNAKMSKASGTS